MHQNACGRTRIGIWSSDDTQWMGENTGNNNNRNTRKIRLRSDVVPCFRAEPVEPGPLPVGIDGPTFLCKSSSSYVMYSPTLEESNLTAPVTYLWEWSQTGIRNWHSLGTSENIYINSSVMPLGGFFLRLRMADGSPSTGFFTQYIRVLQCGLSYPGEVTNTILLDNKSLSIYPNPTSGVLYLSGNGVPGIKNIHFVNVQGEELNIEYLSQEENLIVLNLRFIAPGTYFIQVTDIDNKKHSFKIIKL